MSPKSYQTPLPRILNFSDPWISIVPKVEEFFLEIKADHKGF
jgi:hypothetical protein